MALHKDASQRTIEYVDMESASQAVDGIIDTLSYHHCAVLSDAQDAWWMVDLGGIYRVSRVVVYNSATGDYHTQTIPGTICVKTCY